MAHDHTDPEKSAMSSDDDAAQHRAARRRRLDSVFGDDLPELTSDESDEHHTGHSKDWFEAQRPPHHG
ncbi:hypothetical protein CYJ73_20880 [Gordonia terrae]|uniref:Uncharacterized protein n=1 Tax=Gordonia terrae TaxID=2055 RepID=A0A2I1R3I7_9ACTN|nr:hypothetical protein CYJ73_20880 [Gordonia terrae]